MIRKINLISRSSVLLGIALFFGCRKHVAGVAGDKAALIHAAQAFIDSVSLYDKPVNYRAAAAKTIRWDLAQVVTVGGGLAGGPVGVPAVSVPIVFKDGLLMKSNLVGDQLFHLDYLTRLVFYRGASGLSQALVITAFPDSNFFKDPTRAFSGLKFVEDWLGHPIGKLLYAADGTVKQYVGDGKQPDAAIAGVTCYTITGYNYVPSLGETVLWTEPAGCTVDYDETIPSNGGSVGQIAGAAGGAGAGSSKTVTVLPGNSVIKSIKTYFQCFTNVGGADHTYTVTVCVDQPDPGTRTPWTMSGSGSAQSSAGGNPVDAGHAFLILTETYGSTTITRNVGFYPSGNVNPLSANSQGVLNDDEIHTYNISGSFNVNNAQFFNLLNFVSQGSNAGYLYNLNNNNCTTFVIDAASQAGIILPRTIGTWLDGAGNDPGDLGEDLRKNNISGIKLDLSGGSDNSHYNVGLCN